MLKRGERLARLEEEGRWQEGESILHLPKVRNIKIVIKKRKKAKEEDEVVAEGTTAESGPAAESAPAQDAKST